MRTWIGAVLLASLAGGVALIRGAEVRATRFKENPLITLAMSRSIGDNANGPTVIRVPAWVHVLSGVTTCTSRTTADSSSDWRTQTLFEVRGRSMSRVY